jgi:hypothetical protein
MISFIKNIFFNKKIISAMLVASFLLSFFASVNFFKNTAKAISKYDSRGGSLVVGIEKSTSQTNMGS